MEVILSQDVAKLGKAGSVVKVKEGYARNFLIPRKMAVSLTAANLKKLEEEKNRKDLLFKKQKSGAEAMRGKLAGLSLTIPALAKEDDKLYGSITTQEIVNSLKEEGFEIDKNCIILGEPLKSLGIYEVLVRLHPEVDAKIKVWIVKK